MAALDEKKDVSEDLLVSRGGDASTVGSSITVLVLLDDTLTGTTVSGSEALRFSMPLLDIREVDDQDGVVSSEGNVVLLTVSRVVDVWKSVVDGSVTVTNAVLVVTT